MKELLRCLCALWRCEALRHELARQGEAVRHLRAAIERQEHVTVLPDAGAGYGRRRDDIKPD